MKPRYIYPLILLSALALFGCKPEPVPQVEVKQEQAKEPEEWKSWTPLDKGHQRVYKNRFKEAPIPVKRQAISEHNSIIYYPHGIHSYDVKVAQEWPREDLSDASAYDQPRMVFYWNNQRKGTDEERRRKVWSIKLDHTDLRLVYDAPGLGGGNADPVMSPDGRFLVVNSGKTKQVVNIATGEVTEVGNDSGRPVFAWTADSRFVFFGDGNYYKRYDTQSGKIKQYTSDEYTHGIYHQYVGNKRIVVHTLGYEIYKNDTNELVDDGLKITAENHSVNRSRIVLHSISLDPMGQWLYVRNNVGENIYVDLEQKKLFKNNCNISLSRIGPKGVNAYFPAYTLNLKDCSRKSVWMRASNSGGQGPAGSFYNLQGVDDE